MFRAIYAFEMLFTIGKMSIRKLFSECLDNLTIQGGGAKPDGKEQNQKFCCQYGYFGLFFKVMCTLKIIFLFMLLQLTE